MSRSRSQSHAGSQSSSDGDYVTTVVTEIMQVVQQVLPETDPDCVFNKLLRLFKEGLRSLKDIIALKDGADDDTDLVSEWDHLLIDFTWAIITSLAAIVTDQAGYWAYIAIAEPLIQTLEEDPCSISSDDLLKTLNDLIAIVERARVPAVASEFKALEGRLTALSAKFLLYLDNQESILIERLKDLRKELKNPVILTERHKIEKEIEETEELLRNVAKKRIEFDSIDIPKMKAYLRRLAGSWESVGEELHAILSLNQHDKKTETEIPDETTAEDVIKPDMKLSVTKFKEAHMEMFDSWGYNGYGN